MKVGRVLGRLLSLASPSRNLDSNLKKGCVKSARCDDRKPDKFGLSCKASNCSDTCTGGLGLPPTHETQTAQGECRRKYK